MTHDKQPQIKHGFTDMSGNEWNDAYVDCYNSLTNDINKSAGREVKADSLVQQERDFFLDCRHRNYVAFMNMCAR